MAGKTHKVNQKLKKVRRIAQRKDAKSLKLYVWRNLAGLAVAFAYTAEQARQLIEAELGPDNPHLFMIQHQEPTVVKQPASYCHLLGRTA